VIRLLLSISNIQKPIVESSRVESSRVRQFIYDDRRRTNNTVGNILDQSHGKCVCNLMKDLNMW